ncbi:MAG: 30S ribosomal protein S12 methylthiotransferase RimO [Propionibacteriales bacterium]|nr:30S ribosomal protein S12 methylthiotransferase RimO [Propionibacteriales bacterium]
MTDATTVALVTLGCARNEVDSEELAARLEHGGFRLVDDSADADAVVVNTCGFVEAAKKDSVDTLLAASDLKTDGRAPAVLAVGCMAERYGKELAEALPEADGVLGFDDYPDISARIRSILDGNPHVPHTPRDRRQQLPIAPADRHPDRRAEPGDAGSGVAGRQGAPEAPRARPASPGGGPTLRRRMTGSPVAPLKLASGCDRRCSFCAIPTFRGAFLSRRPTDIVAEARWLAGQDVRELFLVSENSTSYGKDLGDLRLLESLLPELVLIEGVRRVRVSYLQPAEMRPSLIDAMTRTPGVAAYFDLSFQHASEPVLRRMRRFGGAESFLGLLEQIRERMPEAGVRSNVIVGFPGEAESDLEVLSDFLERARLDAIGVFGYSDEDGTEAAGFGGKLDDDEIRARVEHITGLAEELTTQRAEDRRGEPVDVLVDRYDGGVPVGRAAHQGPEVDGCTTLSGAPDVLRVGDVVRARVTGNTGIDLHAEVLEVVA